MLGKGLSSLIPKKDEGEKDSKEITPPPRPFGTGRSSAPAAEAALGPSAFRLRQERRPNSERPRDLPQDLSGGVHHRKPSGSESIFQIEVEKIKPNPYQPRRHFDEEGLRELADSIRAHGILQPLVVSKIEKETESGTDVEYQLIAGERRLKAAKLLGLKSVPAIIKKIDDRRLKLEMALIENLQRSNLNPLEAARAYTRLSEEFGLTQQEISSRVGKSRESVANTMRLLKLPPHIQEALSGGQINESQARTLLALDNPQEQERAFAALLNDRLSVRELRQKTVSPKPNDPQQVYWERQLEEKLGAPVKLIKRGPQGKVVIPFRSEEEWRNILDKLIGPDQ